MLGVGDTPRVVRDKNERVKDEARDIVNSL